MFFLRILWANSHQKKLLANDELPVVKTLVDIGVQDIENNCVADWLKKESTRTCAAREKASGRGGQYRVQKYLGTFLVAVPSVFFL